jgi:hypothetical protein
MRIAGEWFACDDGVIRPVVRIYATAENDERERDRFLVDSGSDRTVLSAHFVGRLRVSGDSPPAGFGLQGIGGGAGFVVVRTVLEFARDDGVPATVNGEFAAFTDPRATDLSILGRDVLDLLDVILSRRRDEVLLLAPAHQYYVTQA